MHHIESLIVPGALILAALIVGKIRSIRKKRKIEKLYSPEDDAFWGYMRGPKETFKK